VNLINCFRSSSALANFNFRRSGKQKKGEIQGCFPELLQRIVRRVAYRLRYRTPTISFSSPGFRSR